MPRNQERVAKIYGRQKKPSVDAHKKWYQVQQIFKNFYKNQAEERERKGQKQKQKQKQVRLSRRTQQKRKEKRQRKEQRRQVAHQQRHLVSSDLKILRHKNNLQKRYGFVSDPRLPPWANFENAAGKLDVSLLQSCIHNKPCHNLLRNNTLPAGTHSLLGLNLNYCIKPSSISDMTTTTVDRLSNDLRRMFHLRESVGGSYIPSLYLKSDYKFELASEKIEKAVKHFSSDLKNTLIKLQQLRVILPNLPSHLFNLMSTLKDHNDYIVVEEDKNLGPCILDRSYYIYRALEDHLGNETNYKVFLPSKPTANNKGYSTNLESGC